MNKIDRMCYVKNTALVLFLLKKPEQIKQIIELSGDNKKVTNHSVCEKTCFAHLKH